MSDLSERVREIDADDTMDAVEKSVEIPGDRTADEEDGDSQDFGGEDTVCSTDQEVEDEDPSREQTSSEVEVEKDDVDQTDASLDLRESEKRRSFDLDHPLQPGDGGNDGSTSETANRSIGGSAETNSPHVFSGGSRTDGRRNLPPRVNAANRGGGRCGRAATEARAAATGQDLSKFNSQYIQYDLKRTVEAIHAQQKHFTLPEKIATNTEQLMKQMNLQVGDLTQSMVKSKMDAINLRLNKLAEKYEKIKQLEDQMKESNQILDLLLERR